MHLLKITSVTLTIGDHVFIANFEDFDIFELLPSKLELDKERGILKDEKEGGAHGQNEPVISSGTQNVKQGAEVEITEWKLDIEQLRIAADKKAKQNSRVLLKLVLLGNEK